MHKLQASGMLIYLGFKRLYWIQDIKIKQREEKLFTDKIWLSSETYMQILGDFGKEFLTKILDE